MRLTWVTLGALALIAPGLLGQSSQHSHANDSLVTSIDRFLADPMAQARLGRALMDTANARADVAMSISFGIVPWLCHIQNAPDERRALLSLLLGAYVVGNMRAQLVSGVAHDAPGAGAQAVVRVYQEVRQHRPTFTEATVTQWVQMDSMHTLAAHADSLAARADTTCR